MFENILPIVVGFFVQLYCNLYLYYIYIVCNIEHQEFILHCQGLIDSLRMLSPHSPTSSTFTMFQNIPADVPSERKNLDSQLHPNNYS